MPVSSALEPKSFAFLDADQAIRCQSANCTLIAEEPGKETIPNLRFYCMVAERVALRKQEFGRRPPPPGTASMNFGQILAAVAPDFDKVTPAAVTELAPQIPDLCPRNYKTDPKGGLI